MLCERGLCRLQMGTSPSPLCVIRVLFSALALRKKAISQTNLFTLGVQSNIVQYTHTHDVTKTARVTFDSIFALLLLVFVPFVFVFVAVRPFRAYNSLRFTAML